MIEKLSNNLNILMAEAHISADELGRRTGLPASTIKKIRNNDNPNPTLTSLLPLAQYFSITLSQLVGDEPLTATRIKGAYQTTSEMIQHIPLISWEEAILWPTTKEIMRHFVTTEHTYGKNAYALIVEEEDWENLAKGTALLVDPSLKPEHRDFVIVHKDGQSTPTLKQVLYDEGQIYLKPVIHGYNITMLTPEHKLLGVIVEYKMHLKKIITKISETVS